VGWGVERLGCWWGPGWQMASEAPWGWQRIYISYDGFCLPMYDVLFRELHDRLPLTSFEVRSLSHLQMAPSQFHPLSWELVTNLSIFVWILEQRSHHSFIFCLDPRSFRAKGHFWWGVFSFYVFCMIRWYPFFLSWALVFFVYIISILEGLLKRKYELKVISVIPQILTS